MHEWTSLHNGNFIYNIVPGFMLYAGDVIIPSRCWFSFIFSSDSNATAYEYDGKISVAKKGKDYVILDFHQVKFDCSFGEYTIDGYLNCPLYEES